MIKFFKIISHIYWKLYWFIKITIYKRKGSNHIFDVRIDDFKYKLTFGSQPITANIVQRIEGRREPETMAIYKSIIHPGMKVLELGACFGEFTVLINYLVGSKGKLVAIEGTPNIFSILENNYKINKLKNTEIYNLFISNSKNKVIFNKKDNHPYNAINKLKQLNEADNINQVSKLSSDYIEQQNLDLYSFLDKIKFYPDIIVMDIEGFEVDVIDSLFLNHNIGHRPIILFEVHESAYGEKDLEYMLKLLKENNYRYRRINTNILCYHN